jgi:hypothetical protein
MVARRGEFRAPRWFVGQDAAIAISEAGILLPGEVVVPEERKANATWVFEKRNGLPGSRSVRSV